MFDFPCCHCAFRLSSRYCSKRFVASWATWLMKLYLQWQENNELNMERLIIFLSYLINMLLICFSHPLTLNILVVDSKMRLWQTVKSYKMPHKAAFHQGLQCLLRQKRSSEKEIKVYLEIITADPSNYTMDQLSTYKFRASSLKLFTLYILDRHQVMESDNGTTRSANIKFRRPSRIDLHNKITLSKR